MKSLDSPESADSLVEQRHRTHLPLELEVGNFIFNRIPCSLLRRAPLQFDYKHRSISRICHFCGRFAEMQSSI